MKININIKKLSLYLLGLGLINNYQMINLKNASNIIKNFLKVPKNTFYEYNLMKGQRILSQDEIVLLKGDIKYILEYIDSNLSLISQDMELSLYFKNKYSKIKAKDLLQYNYNILKSLENYFNNKNEKIKIEKIDFDKILRSLYELQLFTEGLTKNILYSSEIIIRSSISNDYDFYGNQNIYFILKPISNILESTFGKDYDLKELNDLYNFF